jgi:hypothetical protein
LPKSIWFCIRLSAHDVPLIRGDVNDDPGSLFSHVANLNPLINSKLSFQKSTLSIDKEFEVRIRVGVIVWH